MTAHQANSRIAFVLVVLVTGSIVGALSRAELRPEIIFLGFVLLALAFVLAFAGVGIYRFGQAIRKSQETFF